MACLASFYAAFSQVADRLERQDRLLEAQEKRLRELEIKARPLVIVNRSSVLYFNGEEVVPEEEGSHEATKPQR